MADTKRSLRVQDYGEAAHARLVLAAKHGTSMHYDDLAGAIAADRRMMGQVLKNVIERCKAAGEPCLTSLVVSKATNTPSDGYRYVADFGYDTDDWRNEQERCWRHWSR
jgi:hypothetical protein